LRDLGFSAIDLETTIPPASVQFDSGGIFLLASPAGARPWRRRDNEPIHLGEHSEVAAVGQGDGQFVEESTGATAEGGESRATTSPLGETRVIISLAERSQEPSLLGVRKGVF
jgi:hypothetical protein